MKNVIYTPHVGPESSESIATIHELALDNIAAFLEDGKLLTPYTRKITSSR